MTSGNDILLSADRLAVGYGKPVLRGISIDIVPGECILLCGANGSGKSTLLRTFAGAVPPLSGQIQASGISLIPARIPKIAGFTLAEFIRLSQYRGGTWRGRPGPAEEEALDQTLRMLDIGTLADRGLATLSDGEFQRGCIATALIRILLSERRSDEPAPAGKQGAESGMSFRKSGLILLDEPTAFLDVEGRLQVLQVLRDIVRETGASVLFSSHDLADSMAVASRILGITTDGRLLDARPGESDRLLAECFPTFQRNSLWNNRKAPPHREAGDSADPSRTE